MSMNESAKALPGIYVGKDVINNRVKLYRQHKHLLLSNEMSKEGREETKSIWYSKAHIETWLSEMNTIEADGMRVYFGQYTPDEINEPTGQLCLLMVLTRGNGEKESIHQDIIYENEPTYAARLQNTPSMQTETEKGGNDTIFEKEFNYGAPCPPICITDGQEFPYESLP
jgi:hypothetical protein